MKKIIIILIIVVLIAAGFAFLEKDRIIKYLIVARAQNIIGAPVEIGTFCWDIDEQTITITGFKLFNPPGYPEEAMLDIPSIKTIYDFAALLKGHLVISQIVINLREVAATQDKGGKLNVDSLKIVEEAQGLSEPKDHALRLHIEVFTLSIGRVVYKVYKSENNYSTKVYNLNIINQNYEDIPDIQHLIILMIKESLKRTTIKGAAVVGISAAAGVGFWPVGVASVVMGKDSASASFKADSDKVYQTCLAALEKTATVRSKNKDKGIIKVKLQGYHSIVQVEKNKDGTTRVTVSARKLLLPRPQFARELLYDISQNLH